MADIQRQGPRGEGASEVIPGFFPIGCDPPAICWKLLGPPGESEIPGGYIDHHPWKGLKNFGCGDWARLNRSFNKKPQRNRNNKRCFLMVVKPCRYYILRSTLEKPFRLFLAGDWDSVAIHISSPFKKSRGFFPVLRNICNHIGRHIQV